jgi:YVTN family beta-propeller protein
VQLTIYRIKVSKKRLRGLNAYGAVADKDERLFGDRFGDSPVPVGILVHPDGKLAYVANTNADVISVIDLQTMMLVDRLVAGKEPDGMAFAGKR